MFQIQWSDACLLVYLVTDGSSFDYAIEVLTALKRTPPHSNPSHGPASTSSTMPLALLGNKTDLDHETGQLPSLCTVTKLSKSHLSQNYQIRKIGYENEMRRTETDSVQ